jgi:hypothetical protein
VPVPGTELWPAVRPLVPGLSCLSFFLSSGIDVIYVLTHTHTHTHIEKWVPLHPCVPRSPTVASQGPGTQVSHPASQDPSTGKA